MAEKPEKELTCQSCQYWRHDGCHIGYSGWPDKKAIECLAFQYLPGSDENED